MITPDKVNVTIETISENLIPSEKIKLAVKNAGLDWTVSCRIPTVKETAVNENGEVYLTGREIQLENSFHIMRDDNNYHFQHATGRFEPIQNERRMAYFEKYLGKGGLELSKMGSLKNGALVYGQAKIGPEMTVKGQDASQSFFTVAGSHDGTVPAYRGIAQTQIVCLNTFMYACGQISASGQKGKKHTKGFDLSLDIANADRIIGLAWDDMRQMNEIANKLADTAIDFNGNLAKEFLINLTDASKLTELVNGFKIGSAEKLVNDEMLTRTAKQIQTAILTGTGQELSVRQNTAWGLFNGVTYFADHMQSAKKSDDSRSTSSMFGTGAMLKERAFNLIQEYAGIA